MREFDTGATRDHGDKIEPAGYFSPLALKAFSEYMLKHQTQADGTKRSSRNWRKGIPQEVYEESLSRHWIDTWLHLDGFGSEARETLKDALCGMLFNVQGLLHELELEEKELNRGRTD
jgi:hypothetical protein